MPYKDPEQQARYYRERQERRKTDPEYIAKRKASFKNRYDNDPEFNEKSRKYQRDYRKNRRASDAGYREKINEATRWNNRKQRGAIFTDEQQAVFIALIGCEVCQRIPERGLVMDHCHDCGHYRGGLCSGCNTHEGVLRKWQAICTLGSPMRTYMDRHVCHQAYVGANVEGK